MIKRVRRAKLPIGINTEKYYYYTFGDSLPWYYQNIGEGNGTVRISVYDKIEDFNFKIVNFPYLDSNIPRNPAYGVYISQLVGYARICSRKDDFIYRHRRLSLKLQQQGYKYQQLMNRGWKMNNLEAIIHHSFLFYYDNSLFILLFSP